MTQTNKLDGIGVDNEDATCVASYDMSIHSNPDAAAWTKLFRETNPDCNVDDQTMLGWFANAMMAMHDKEPVAWKVVDVTDVMLRLDVTSSTTYELTVYAHIASFYEELETSCKKYGYNYKDMVNQDLDLFDYYHLDTYLQLKANETVEA
jgi:hypothetical protein